MESKPQRYKAPETFLELSVRISDGSFDTTLRQPVNAPVEAKKQLALSWMDLIQKALHVHAAIQTADAPQEAPHESEIDALLALRQSTPPTPSGT